MGLTGLSSLGGFLGEMGGDDGGIMQFPCFPLPSVLATASVCPSRFYSACGTQEMLCIHVAVPLASNFKINCLRGLTARERMENATFRECVLEEL